jgi:hypothetical protein
MNTLKKIKRLLFNNKLIHISLTDPLRTWKKAKKYFKKPSLSFHFFTNPIYDCPFANLRNMSKILEVWSSDVWWKDKYDSPRFEGNPFIYVCFFKSIGFSICFNVIYIDELGRNKDCSMLYWEYLLDFVYYNRPLSDISTWTFQSRIHKEYIQGKAEDGSEDSYVPMQLAIPTQLFALNKQGLKKLTDSITK